MERTTVSSGHPFEPVVGYSRAVRTGSRIAVSGTAARMPDDSDPPADSYLQARRCLEIVLEALAELGAGPEHVVRTRIFLTPAADFAEVGRAHAEVFGEIRPAATGVVVQSLLDPRWLVEIEADAELA